MSFGLQNSKKKNDARRMTSFLFSELFCSTKSVYFFDESSFCASDFGHKVWIKKDEDEKMVVRHPTINTKLMCLVSRDEVLSFRLSRNTPTKHDIQEFLLASIIHERKFGDVNRQIFLVLDNAPKNKSRETIKKLKKLNVSIAFITPGTPDLNIIENVFFFCKQFFGKWKHLEQLNSRASVNEVLEILILKSLAFTANEKMKSVQKMYLNGLIKLQS